MSASNPVPLTGSSNQLKKSVGNLIIKINSEILELQQEYRKVKAGASLSKKGTDLENAVKEKKKALEEALECMEGRRDYIIQETMEKTVQMVKDNIATASKVLDNPSDENEVSESDVNSAKDKAAEAIEEIEAIEEQVEEDMRRITLNLSSLAPVSNVSHGDVDTDDGDQIERDLTAIGKYQRERFHKMEKEIKENMDHHKKNLLDKWKNQKDILDYQALKEIRYEFEGSHKKMRYMVSEWDRRKYSDRLSDQLTDIIDQKWDEYMKEYRRMDEEKRTEAAIQRKRNLELEDYKREKRRPIPTWPKTLPYTKFKPDLLSWDKEHKLSSGSVKFGLLAEMLKNQQRITTYEQIQTRLGNNRNESDIICQVVSLLDTINEETIYNKLSSAWSSVAALRKIESQTLNDFFSKFETVQYSLNLADDTFQELEPVEAGKDLEYYQKREKMLSRKIEMNDKLKAVQLIKALGVDEAHKRDILAKVDFKNDPKQVYLDTKTAIRDICGEKLAETEDKPETSDKEVLLVKPWQEKKKQSEYHSRNRSGERGRDRFRGRSFSRDRSSDRFDRSRERSDRSRNFSGKSRDRSDSRGRRSSVSFHDRRDRRETTPGPGTSAVIAFNQPYDRIFNTDEFFKIKTRQMGQYIIVDSGCPRSLMGDKEFDKLKESLKLESKHVKEERFKFGPSRIYVSKVKAIVPLELGDNVTVKVEFFVVKGNIPILLGNDIMVPLGGKLHLDLNKLELKNLGKEILLEKTPGGHFIIPAKSVTNTLDNSEPFDDSLEVRNVNGTEADAVMLTLLANIDVKG